MRVKRILKWSAITISGGVGMTGIALLFSSKTVSLFVRPSFEDGNEFVASNHEQVTKNVEVRRDIDYDSSKLNGTLFIN